VSPRTPALTAPTPPATEGHVPRLLSPAVVTQQSVPGGTELLFAGTVTGAGGRPLRSATLQLWGVSLAADHTGSFEILAHGHHAGPPHIEVTVTALGYHPLRTEIAFATSSLADGTSVVLHNFVLEPVLPRSAGVRR
jgi:hypothetical protein